MQRTELSMAFFFLALLCWYPSECEAAAEARDALDICYHTPNHIFTVYTPWFQFSFDSGHNIIGFSVVLLWPTISFSWFSLNSGIKKFFTFFSKLTWNAIKLVSFALNFFQRKNWNGKIEKESQQELTIHCLNWMSVYACASEWVCACIDFERWNSRFLGFSCWNSCNPAHSQNVPSTFCTDESGYKQTEHSATATTHTCRANENGRECECERARDRPSHWQAVSVWLCV